MRAYFDLHAVKAFLEGVQRAHIPSAFLFSWRLLPQSRPGVAQSARIYLEPSTSSSKTTSSSRESQRDTTPRRRPRENQEQSSGEPDPKRRKKVLGTKAQPNPVTKLMNQNKHKATKPQNQDDVPFEFDVTDKHYRETLFLPHQISKQGDFRMTVEHSCVYGKCGAWQNRADVLRHIQEFH
ncbi:uncharacterized protein LOC117643312 [Thrips palmi]|uniref:Uncharacterized protein LOC117643312 n=1 Tax=Thrips palmi TaxID=161013 RepID=A0A6P8ZL10_THRPL|nr:uncharacterized protein LOC117643312 [Thrips palmi]